MDIPSSTQIADWYARSNHRLTGGGLWLKGGEPNTMPAELFAGAKVRLLIARLSTYRDVATSMTHGLLAQIAREVEGVFVDFAFLPPPRDYPLMRDAGIPLWLGTGTKQPPAAFDVLGISNSIVLELLNLPDLLLGSGIPLAKSERLKRPDIPLVILGGANSPTTSILGGEPCLVDAVIVGEGEVALKQLLELVRRGKAEGWPKDRILHECHGNVDGFYEPDRREQRLPVRKALVGNLDEVRTLEDGPIWYDEESLGVGNLQISSGCPCFCSFCEESWTQKPYRERSLPKLLAAAEAAKARQGLEELNLFSFNFNFHSQLYPVIFELSRRVARVGLKSQRFDLLSQDPHLMAVERRIGKLSLTCGMEGISERLRRYLHKNLTQKQILDSCKAIFAAHARELKVFLIATGLEEDDDFEEFDAFVSKLLDLKRVKSPGTRLIFSLAPLFNPPHTPLQFAPCPAADLDNLERSLRAIERVCAVHKVEHRRSGEPHETWLMQLLAPSDRRLTPALVRSSCEDRFVFYGSAPKEVCERWRGYLRALNLSESNFFAEKSADAVFPWDDIDVGVGKQFLWEEYERARQFEEEDYCLGRPNRAGRCLACGACPDETHIRHLTSHRAASPFIMDDLDALLARRKNPQVIRAVVRVEAEGQHLPPKFIATALARGLMLAVPELTLPFLSHVGNLLDRSPKGWLEAPLFGLNAFDLAFIRPSPLDQLPAKVALINAQCRDFKVLHIQLDPPPLVEPHYALLRIAFDASPPLEGVFPKRRSTDSARSRRLQPASFGPLSTSRAPTVGATTFGQHALESILRSSDATYTTRAVGGDRLFRVSAKSRRSAEILVAKVTEAEGSVSLASRQGCSPPMADQPAGGQGNEQPEGCTPEWQRHWPHGSLVLAVSPKFSLKRFLKACRSDASEAPLVETLAFYAKASIAARGRPPVRCPTCGEPVQEIPLIEAHPSGCLLCTGERVGKKRS